MPGSVGMVRAIFKINFDINDVTQNNSTYSCCELRDFCQTSIYELFVNFVGARSCHCNDIVLLNVYWAVQSHKVIRS